MTKSRRKQLLINPRFQIDVMIKFGLLFIGFILMQMGFLFYTFNRFQNLLTTMGIDSEHPLFKYLARQQEIFFQTSFGLFIVWAIIFLVFALYISNKIAGPIYRLTKFYEGKISGAIPKDAPLAFRKGDYFTEVPEVINQFAQKR